MLSSDYPSPTSSPDGPEDGQRSWPNGTATTTSPRIPGFNELASLASLNDKSSELSSSQHRKPLSLNPFAQRLSAAWYLDSVTARGLDISIPSDLKWLDVAPFALTVEQARVTAERYFGTAHSWLPIVSKTRIIRVLSNYPALCASADFAALLVAMDLLSDSEMIPRTPSDLYAEGDASTERDARSRQSVYQSLKAVLSACEQRGQFTTSCLAAYVLTAAYEAAQGMYPAAYFTVGSCARICHTLGLHNRRYATQLTSKIDTWNEAEERRRLWWATIIFDRLVTVGFLFRPMAIPSIPPNEIMPSMDDIWDEGEISVNPVLIMSIESQTKVSPFARTCQAAHLVGRVIDHNNEHADPTDVDFHFQEALSIMRAGEALLEMVRAELNTSEDAGCKFFGAMGLCCTALLALYGTHSCIEVDPIESSGRNRGIRVEMQQKGIDGYRRIASVVSEFAGDISVAPMEKVSPLVLNCLYEAGCSFAWIYRENQSEGQLASLQTVRAVLATLEPRWAVAGELIVLPKRMCNVFLRNLGRRDGSNEPVREWTLTTDR